MDLFRYTKKIAQRIKYYDSVADFAQDSHWYNPFYQQEEIVIIWTDKPKEKKYYSK